MRELENEIIKYWVKDGILFSVYRKPVKGTYEVIKSVIDLRHQISNNAKQYWCYNLHGLKSMNKDARDYADQNGQELLHACAVVVSSK